MGMTIDEVRRDWYDPIEPDLTDEEIDRLLA
jgi:hypothetical protein